MGTTWPQHRYDISITHQQQFLQQQHDNLYNNSSTRITATASVGSNFKTIRFCATHKHKANQRQQQQQQQQQQHYASQHLRQQQHQQQEQLQLQQQQMMYQPANVRSPGPQMRTLTAIETPSTGCAILWTTLLQAAMLLFFLSCSNSRTWLILLPLWSLLQGFRSRIASPRALAYHAYLPKSVRTLRNNNESSINTAKPQRTTLLRLQRLRQSASLRICKSLHALYFRWLSSSICCLYSMQVRSQESIESVSSSHRQFYYLPLIDKEKFLVRRSQKFKVEAALNRAVIELMDLGKVHK
uniref:MIP22259p n=1 Tax=Drosophila melanogaster TaxID=7227 RepID=D5SHU4_DROME|nr:MIP22259p [Drosophila melanogaster]